jgi:HTH-type transcriptional regulator, glycine betaine synthesis regulator
MLVPRFIASNSGGEEKLRDTGRIWNPKETARGGTFLQSPENPPPGPSAPTRAMPAVADILCSFSIEQFNGSVILRSVKRNPIETVDAPDGAKSSRLNPVEVEVIHLFVQLSRALGQPPSVAEIYGLLFISPKALPQDEFIERLNLSKGSASQGLRYLLDLGAVRTVYVAADRRVHYEAVAELRNLANRFLRQQVLTYFEDSADRLDRIQAEARELSDGQREFTLQRVRMLKSWERNAKRILPLVLAILGRGMSKNGK